MKIEIDQSGKIENTNRDTAVAFSNDICRSILIKARDKREIQDIFRQAGKSRIFVYKLFAILIFILIKSHISKINEITIDKEYPGKDDLIKIFLLRQIRKIIPDFSARDIIFSKIGKKSKAHSKAYKTFTEKEKPDRTVSLKEVLKILVE